MHYDMQDYLIVNDLLPLSLTSSVNWERTALVTILSDAAARASIFRLCVQPTMELLRTYFQCTIPIRCLYNAYASLINIDHLNATKR